MRNVHYQRDLISRFILYIVLLCFISGVSGCSNEDQISDNRLPEVALQFVDKWFSGESIKTVCIVGAGYEVTMSDGTQIAFDVDGMWFFIENRNCPLPIGILPTEIKNYLDDNRSGTGVLLLERDSVVFRVGLDTQELVTFDAQYDVSILPWNLIENNVEL